MNKKVERVIKKLNRELSKLIYKKDVFIDIHPMTKNELNRNCFFMMK